MESLKNSVPPNQEIKINDLSDGTDKLVVQTGDTENMAKLLYEGFHEKQRSTNSLSPLKRDIELVIHPDGTVESPWWTKETSILLCAVCGMQGSAGCLTCTNSQQWCG